MNSQQKFIGRKDELIFLEKKYKSNKPEFIVVYGRRRIGKTELLLQFMKNKNSIYFLSTNESEKVNLENMKKVMFDYLNDKLFNETPIDNWFNLFELFIRFKKTKEKIIICIDEFPYLINLNKAIPSIFQKIWDLNLKNNNIMLILNGSSISMMEEYVLFPKSPLYGRRTGQWNLAPLSLNEFKPFFPKMDIEQILMTYSILGGIPGYMNKFDKSNVWDNVKENILFKGSFLYEEVEFLLRDEFREPKNYKLILFSISLGNHTLGEICNHTGLDKSMVSKYLDVLKKTYIIEEIIPITSKPNSKKRWYYIIDEYFYFWFKYIYKNKIYLESNRINEVLNKIKKDFPLYMGLMFEKICLKLLRNKKILCDKEFSDIGKWWYKENEIDIVALNDKEILFCECKYKDNVDAEKIYNELKEKSKLIEHDKKENYAIFAKSFKKKIKNENLKLYDLKDIENSFNEDL